MEEQQSGRDERVIALAPWQLAALVTLIVVVIFLRRRCAGRSGDGS